MTDEERSDESAGPDGDEPITVYEWSEDESAAEAVTSAISAASSQINPEIEPLYEVVDPDALDCVFGPMGDGSPRLSGGQVTFDYCGYQVQVGADDTVFVFRQD